MKLLGLMVTKDMVSNMPFLGGVDLNARTGTFAGVVALLAALLLAAVPTFRLSFQKVRTDWPTGTTALSASSGEGWERTWWSLNW